MRLALIAGLLLAALSAATSVQAFEIIDLLGDRDGYGVDCPAGAHFTNYGAYWGDYRTGSDPAFTDVWDAGDRGWNHWIDWSGYTVEFASLELMIGGIADHSDWWADINVNGTPIARIDGREVAPDWGPSSDWSQIYLIGIPPNLIRDFSVNISIDVSDNSDGYIIDYSQLKIGTEIPEPTTMILLGLGLLRLGILRRKR